MSGLRDFIAQPLIVMWRCCSVRKRSRLSSTFRADLVRIGPMACEQGADEKKGTKGPLTRHRVAKGRWLEQGTFGPKHGAERVQTIERDDWWRGQCLSHVRGHYFAYMQMRRAPAGTKETGEWRRPDKANCEFRCCCRFSLSVPIANANWRVCVGVWVCRQREQVVRSFLTLQSNPTQQSQFDYGYNRSSDGYTPSRVCARLGCVANGGNIITAALCVPWIKGRPDQSDAAASSVRRASDENWFGKSFNRQWWADSFVLLFLGPLASVWFFLFGQ